ncbi:MAG: UDP-N-acetylmuramoylalanyl-D-glutamyl-2, 6-diaminopimelate--D-alanyl-D-alanine ligase, partial [Alphaproteobacteria bacterium]
TVASAHREFFDSEEAIADAKAEIFTGLPPDGIAVLNRDNRHFERLAAQARNAGVGHILTFGIDGAADVRAQDIVLHETLSCVAADVAGTRLFFKVGIPGRHWVMNALGALAVVHALDGDLSLAALALAELRPLAGRGARARIATKRGHATVIDESYNANPESMRAALAVLGAAQTRGSGRRIAVLGDMMELGADATRAHGDLASAVIAAKADLVIATGPLMRALAERLIAAGMRCLMAADADGAYEALMPRLRDGDVILVKGSNASGMQRLVDRLKLPPRARPRSDD